MEKITIVYEDEDLVVINKPYDLVVNRAESVKEESVQDWADKYLEIDKVTNRNSLFVKRSGLCHRLDKETSGCLMIAKNEKALNYYLQVFLNRKIDKEYTALVHGAVDPVEGEVRLPLRRSLMDREKFMVHYLGKKAITKWRVVDKADYESNNLFVNKLSLLKVAIMTGRTHQIRVHLSFLGWPIFADDKYLNKGVLKLDDLHLSHHFLHASKLSFVNTKGERVVIESEIDAQMKKLLLDLGIDSSR